MHAQPSGPSPAKVLIVSSWTSVQDARAGELFHDSAGVEFSRALHEAGLMLTDCRTVPIVQTPFPPGDLSLILRKTASPTHKTLLQNRWVTDAMAEGFRQLEKEIEHTSPAVIVALGPLATWYFTGSESVTNYRGSIIQGVWESAQVIPTYSPDMILKVWEWRTLVVRDLQRAKRQAENPVSEPDYDFITAPSFSTAVDILRELERRLRFGPVVLGVDIETRHGHIDCIGIAWSAVEAICIPFFSMQNSDHYFTFDEELEIILRVRDILLHPNARIIGQNFLYDTQYFAKHWGYYVIPHMDTMVAHAVCFPGLPKSLDFLSSIYLPWHSYWKSERKEASDDIDDMKRWRYNCKDSVITWELYGQLSDTIDIQDLRAQYNEVMSMLEPLLFMMLRGVRINTRLRDSLAFDLMAISGEYQQQLQAMTEGVWSDYPLTKSKSAKAWYDSPTQQQKIFYDIFRQPKVYHKKTKRPTVDDDALRKIAGQEPLLAPLCEAIASYRSIGVFLNNFIRAPLDSDSRMRCSYNPVGTETFRLSSSKNAFGTGTNLQNIPKGDE